MLTSEVLAGSTILVVEDEYYLADDMRIILDNAGASVIGPLATIEKAQIATQEENFDCVVLDINLNGELSFDLAGRLMERSIPFIFVSGYDGEIIPKNLRHVPRMTKPIGADAFLRCVAAAVGRPIVQGELAT